VFVKFLLSLLEVNTFSELFFWLSIQVITPQKTSSTDNPYLQTTIAQSFVTTRPTAPQDTSTILSRIVGRRGMGSFLRRNLGT